MSALWDHASDEAARARDRGIHCIPLPTPFGIGPINTYLLDDDPLTLIDTGPNSGLALDALESELAELGKKIEDLELIVVSHQHMDHLGLTEIIARRSGAPVAALGSLAPCLARYDEWMEADDRFAAAVMLRHGIPEETCLALRSVSRSFRGWGAPATVTQSLEEGDTLELRDRTLTVHHRPGHSPSDTIFLDSDSGTLFAADHLIASVSSNPLISRPLEAPIDKSEDPALLARPKSLMIYLESLAKTREMEPIDLILPGHGPGFTNHVELIDERFGMLAFLERLQRDPRQAKLSQQLFEAAFSPALVRKLVQSLPADVADPLAWASGVLEHNLLTDEQGLAIEDHRGVFALIGATGVGKTTSTAKLAAAFATKHGAAALGLITLDAYRVAAHEQLRTYGRILGVPVHTAHDRASLEDLLELLSAKTLVLIDTAGMAQRDARTRELLEMLQHRSISKLLVISAAAQGETLEDVMLGYGVQQCLGVIVSKLDEAVKLGPALDALIRYRAKVVGVANGQRVPEDWHRLSSQALVQRALRGGGGSSWRLAADEVKLLFAATQGGGYPGPQGLVPQA